MRHGKTINHLGRTSSHRKAMLSNMASSLIIHKRIETTVAKAKELRKYVEPLLTRSKNDSTHNRRTAFSYLKNKEVVKELFDSVADKISARPGGYTRIIKLGNRLGDNADMCIIELVDFNETMMAAASEAASKRTRRGRRSTGSAKPAGTAAAEVAGLSSQAAAEDSLVTDVTSEPVAETSLAADVTGEAPEANEGEATEGEEKAAE